MSECRLQSFAQRVGHRPLLVGDLFPRSTLEPLDDGVPIIGTDDRPYLAEQLGFGNSGIGTRSGSTELAKLKARIFLDEVRFTFGRGLAAFQFPHSIFCERKQIGSQFIFAGEC